MPLNASGAGLAVATALSALVGGLVGYGVWRRRAAQQAAAEPPASAAFLQNALDYMADGIVVTDESLRLVAWNRRYREIFSIPEGAITEGDVIDGAIRMALDAGVLLRPDAGSIDDAVDARLAQIREGRGAVMVEQLADGRWIEIVRNALPRGGYVSTFTDITDRKRAERALRVSEERYALAAQGSSEGIWDWDLAAERVYYSPRWRAMLGLSADMVSGRPEDWFERVHPRDADPLRAAVDSYLDGSSDHFSAEFRMLHTDDDYLWVAASGLAVRDPRTGAPLRLVGSMTDVSERKRAEEQLIHDALYDSVTGLPNRALFLDRIEQMLQRRRLQGDEAAGQRAGEDPSEALSAAEGFAVLFLDLDRFKVINDSLGHDVGDELLIDVARRLESAIRPGDSLARLASDEFGVLLGEARTADDALESANWLQSDLAAAFYLRGQEVFTSVCIGVAMPSSGFRKAEDMLRAADIAMYRAKDAGQSSTAVFDPSMQTRAISQLQLESDLRRAVDRDEIEVYYQPIVRFDTGRIAGFEVLARWRHPERGLVAPADFIPPAEDVGLIAAIGAQALRKSARTMREWMRRHGGAAPESISVNLSGRQLQDPDLVRDIELMLAQTGLPGSRLKLEVTESMIMHNPESTARTLMELKDLGVSLSIDDFGTGYSSLSYLHRFPFDTLKIDRSFVAAMEEKRENLEIIRTITLLAHTLGMDVIAEGVESAGQLKRLRELGCESGQGFLFSHPTDAEAAEAFLGDAQRWDLDALVEAGRAAE